MARLGLAFAAAVALLFASALGHAADDVAAAANAYAQAQKATLAGEYAKAAELFELADSLSPTPQALRAAVSAHKAAGELGAAATKAEELEARYPEDGDSKKLAESVLEAARAKLGRIQVTCRPDPCQLMIDGGVVTASPKAEHVVYVDAGERQVVAVFGTRKSPSRTLAVEAGARQALVFRAPAAAEPAKPAAVAPPPSADARRDAPASQGLSPWYFGVAATVTVGLGAVTVWSGLDTLSARDEYDKHRTPEGYEDGQGLERRTNVLIGATGGAAAITTLLALFTDFGGRSNRARARPPTLGFGAGPGAGTATLAGSF